jgi:hypothetical protein
VEYVWHVLDKMFQGDILTWNAMIVGYFKNGHYEVVEVFSAIKSSAIRIDYKHFLCASCDVHLVSLKWDNKIHYVHLVDLKWHNEVHCYLIQDGFIESNLFAKNVLRRHVCQMQEYKGCSTCF